MHIEQLKIKNFKALRDVTIRDIPRFCVIVGENGSGKSSFLDVFRFLHVALASNVQAALDEFGGGLGFAGVKSRGAEGYIEIVLGFRRCEGRGKRDNPLFSYSLSIGERDGCAFVAKEALLLWRRGRVAQRLLDFQNGGGTVMADEVREDGGGEGGFSLERQRLNACDVLAIKGLALFERFSAAAALSEAMAGWHFSDLQVSKLRGDCAPAGGGRLSASGDNLAAVIDWVRARHPAVLENIVSSLRYCAPGLDDVLPVRTSMGQVTLHFKEKAFEAPFPARLASDGAVCMLAYLTLLHSPAPPPALLCVEEPERHIYLHEQRLLAEEFIRHARCGGGQVFVSTHSPNFLNGAGISQVLAAVKRDGVGRVVRADSNEQVKVFVDDGEKMGFLWQEGHNFHAA